jgi:peptidyl-prolyl cis-trans isomerase A (cyclophilin A)
MIQGGDLQGGRGDSGYVIPDEVWEGASHDEPGLLCMANKGPDTGGMQFFITDGVLKNNLSYLDASYTIFGQCIDTDVVESIAKVEAYGDKPVVLPRLESVHIFRQVPPE